jgi:hypothetical protein
MADILMKILSGVNKRFKDMGDGTFAEVIYNANDGTGAGGTGSSGSFINTAAGQAARVALVDPVTGNGSLVQAFHNADNQTIGATSYGLMTGGVNQLLNGAGTLDRKRGVSTDGVAATGLAAEVPMLWNGASYDRVPGSSKTGMKVTVANLPTIGAQTIANSSAVNIASDQTVAVNAAGVSVSGSIAAPNASVALTLNGASGAIIDLRGTFVATLAFQGTVDGMNWVSLAAIPVGSAANIAPVSSVTTIGAWHVLCAGMQQIRAIATAYTSGIITATIRATNAAPFLYTSPAGVTNAVAVSSMAAGTNLLGDVGLQYRGNATGAASVAAVMSTAIPAATSAKTTAGRLLGVMLQNSAATLRSIKLWNALTTGVTLGATPALFEIDIPAGGSVYMAFEGGIGFTNALTYAVTAGKGLTDNTSAGLSVNDVSGSLIYA